MDPCSIGIILGVAVGVSKNSPQDLKFCKTSAKATIVLAISTIVNNSFALLASSFGAYSAKHAFLLAAHLSTSLAVVGIGCVIGAGAVFILKKLASTTLN